MEAATGLGHRVELIHPGRCIPKIKGGKCLSAALDGRRAPEVLLPRIGSTINEYALALVRQFELAGTRLINGFEAIRMAKNKFASMQALAAAGVPVPNSFLVSNPANLQKAVNALGGYPVLLKTPTGRQGSGVMILRDKAGADFASNNLPLREQGIIVQRFIAPEGRRDIRAFVLGRKVIAAVDLKPPPGDFRANVHVGGRASPIELEGWIEMLAVKASACLGLEIAGADIIVDQGGEAAVIEVNYSPGFKGLEASTGIDIASKIIAYAAQAGGR
jgi:ribosomal protein S6--L-glutamate ligase